MQYNLGWATATTINYGAGTGSTQPRQIQVKITQTGISNPATETFTVTQAPQTIYAKGNNPFWQFGRKDPLPPSNGLADGVVGERQLWYGDASYLYVPLIAEVSLGSSIKNPFRMISGISGGYIWCSTNYNNLWDATNAEIRPATLTDTEVVKTVYDPNPVGFKMPPANAWTRFSLAANDVVGTQYINAANVATYVRDGYYLFYTQADGDGPTVRYPITGQRQPPGRELENVTTHGFYNTAHPMNLDAAVRLMIYSERAAFNASTAKKYGCSVRPITE
jgi:hypothetical protein